MTLWTVRDVTEHLKTLLEGDFSMSGLSVRGEISNVKVYPSGHVYFTLKDEESQLRAVMFRSDAARCKFRPQDGQKVVASGRITVYVSGGYYQLAVTDLRADGVGELYAAFLRLKDKLSEEGLFDPSRKQAIPAYPTRIGIVTSEQAAALRDMLTTIQRRHPGMSVLLSGATVQGPDAPRSIVSAIERLVALRGTELAVDVIIVGRGGGSFEELNAFNDEAVARAIAACPIPIVSGVGHETDTTISDWVADERAPTPTAAAARVTPDRAALLRAQHDLRARLREALRRRVVRARERLDGLERRRQLLSAARVLGMRAQRIDELAERLLAAMRRQLQRQRAILSGHAGRLDALSPLQVLGRGYVVCRSPDGEVVTRTRQALPGKMLELVLTDGYARVRAEQVASSREALWDASRPRADSQDEA